MRIQEQENSYEAIIVNLEAQLKRLKEDYGIASDNQQVQHREHLLKFYKSELEELKRPYANCVLKDGNILSDIYEDKIETTTEWTKSLLHNFCKNSAKEVKKEKRELLVIDINYLLPEYKSENPDNLQELLKEKYNRTILLIDSSRANTLGGIVGGIPAYII